MARYTQSRVLPGRERDYPAIDSELVYSYFSLLILAREYSKQSLFRNSSFFSFSKYSLDLLIQ